jgi:hypothetical protein
VYFPADLHSSVTKKLECQKEQRVIVVSQGNLVAEFGAGCDQLLKSVESISPTAS